MPQWYWYRKAVQRMLQVNDRNLIQISGTEVIDRFACSQFRHAPSGRPLT
jgi:hypothetical protein